MKKLFFLLVFCAFTIGGFSQKYDELLQSSKGKYQIVKHNEFWRNTGIRVDEKAGKFIDLFDRAINNRGVTIFSPNKTESFIGMNSSFFYQKQIKKEGIIFHNDLISYTKIESCEVEFAWFVLWGMISVILMMISNFLFFFTNTKYCVLISYITFGAFIFGVMIGFVINTITLSSINFIVSLFTIVATSIAFIMALIIEKGYNKNYKIFSILYYLFIITPFVLLFLF